MKSRQLESDLKTIVKNASNIKSVTKGDVSGASIEIEYTDTASVESFVYYKQVSNRDSDFTELSQKLNLK